MLGINGQVKELELGEKTEVGRVCSFCLLEQDTWLEWVEQDGSTRSIELHLVECSFCSGLLFCTCFTYHPSLMLAL